MKSVEVTFVVGGTADVGRAFDTIERRALRFEQFQKRAANDDVVTTKKTVDEKERAFAKLAADTEKWKRQEQQQSEKSALAEVKATEKAVSAKLRAEESWARQRARIVENSAKLAYRLAEQEVAAVEKAERQKAAARERYARSVGAHALSGAGRGLGSALGGATRMAGMALSLGGGFAIASAVQEQLAAQRAAQQLINATTIAGPDSRATMSNVMQQASATAIKTGMTQEQVLQGSIAYAHGAKGGDIGGALGNMEFFAKLAKVSGTSIEDIGSAAGVLQSQNAALGKDPAAMRQMLLNAYAQTGAGSVSLVDAAKQMGILASTRGFYQGNEAQTQRTLLGLGQLAAPAGSPQEIGTFIKDLSTEAASHRHAKGHFVGLENMGVKFDSTGRMQSPEQMIGAVLKSTNGDLGQIEQIFGKRGLPLFTQLAGTYREGGGGDAGVSAVQKKIAEVTGATMSEDSLSKKFDETMSNPAEQLAKSFEQIKIEVGEALMPELKKLADWLGQEDTQREIKSLIDAFDKIVSWAGKNPMEAVVAALALAAGKGAVTQAVAEALKRAILGGGASVPGAATGTVAGGSAMNQAAMAGGTAAAVYSGVHLYGAGQRAVAAHKGGGNLARSAYGYLDEWQSGAGGWIGGAKWNPLVSLAKMAAFTSGDVGKIEAGENYHPLVGGRHGAPMQASHDETTDLLRQIAKNTMSGSGGGLPGHDTRTHPIGASRGATQ